MEKPNHIDQPEFSTAELAEIIRIRREVEVEMRVDNPVRAKGLGKALQSALETAANAYLLIPRQADLRELLETDETRRAQIPNRFG
jgi:hypothetical protein